MVDSDYITANLFLDRTNTAQFVIAKVALGHQLHALGYLANPHVEYDTGLFTFETFEMNYSISRIFSLKISCLFTFFSRLFKNSRGNV